MARNDIRIDLDFVDHIKVKKLIRKIGYEGFFSLVKLFSVAAKMYQTGELKNYPLGAECQEYLLEQ